MGIEWLKQEFGQGAKPAGVAVHDKIAKACKCSQTMAKGWHKETCTSLPSNMTETLQRLAHDREGMSKQLSKKVLALDHLFGPGPPASVVGGASSSSSGSGTAPKVKEAKKK